MMGLLEFPRQVFFKTQVELPHDDEEGRPEWGDDYHRDPDNAKTLIYDPNERVVHLSEDCGRRLVKVPMSNVLCMSFRRT